MKKNLIKGICLFVAIVLIGNLIGPTFAGLSDFDVGSFMTKAEFDSAFSDIHSRFTTLEANVENKIDSQVVSSVEKCLDVKQSGYVGELLIGFTLRDNCLPLYDDTKDYKKTDYPELYAKMKNDVNLSKLLLAGSDADHFKLLNISDRYGKFGTTANAGDTGDETLPNIKGNSNNNLINHQANDTGIGALKYLFKGKANGMGGSDQPYGQMDFDASRGQADGSGGFVSQANSTYKDGAKVNPDHIVVLPMIRYKLDKVQVDNRECPYAVGDVYQTTSNTNPAERWAGTTWKRIEKGAFLEYTDDSSVVGIVTGEELPNVKGSISFMASDTGLGAFTYANSGSPIHWGSSGTSARAHQTFDLSTGQTNEGGSYKSKAESVYKDGGRVKPKSIALYGWIRIS